MTIFEPAAFPPIDPDSIPRLIDPDRITAMVHVDDTGTDLLRLDLRTVPAQPRSAFRHRIAALAAAAVAVAGLGQVATAPTAQAQVLPTKTYTVAAPLRLVVSAPTTRLTVPLVSTIPGGIRARLSIRLAGDQIGEADVTGRTQAGTVDVPVPSRLLIPGAQVAEVEDLRDPTAPILRIPVQVVRQSRVVVDQVASWPGGLVISGRALHYDAPTGTYKPDLASSVLVQVSRDAGKTWRTSATVGTDAKGSVTAVVNGQTSPTGKALVRLVRQSGATVTGGTSAVRTVVIGKAAAKPSPKIVRLS